jgi:hypothetical protein
LVAAGFSLAQSVTVFQTGFESGEGYSPGGIKGQNGWSAVLSGDPDFGQITATNPLMGSQSALLDGPTVVNGYAGVRKSIAVAPTQNGNALRFIEMAGVCSIVDPTLNPDHISNAWMTLMSGANEVGAVGVGSRFGQHVLGWPTATNSAFVEVQPNTPLEFKYQADYERGLATLRMNGQLVYENVELYFNPFIPTDLRLEFASNSNQPFDTVVRVDDLKLTATYPSLATWNVNVSGNWSEPSNWQDAVPQGVHATAVLGSAISAPRTITVDAPIALGKISLANANAYSIVGNNSLTLDVVLGSVSIEVTQGSHTIAAPLALTDDLDISVAASADTVTISGDITAVPGVGITKLGLGTAAMKHIRADAAAIDSGTLRVISNGSPSGTSRVKSLAVNTGADTPGSLDLTNNGMVVDYDVTSPLADIRALIVTGRNGGDWNGTGITSSTAANTSSTHAIGYGESAQLGLVTFLGQPVDDTAVVLRYTRLGDATLDAVVNLADFNCLAGNFGQSGRTWVQGDFNYDGTVNLIDFNLLAANFGLSAAAGSVSPDDWSRLAASVPEPSAGILMLLTAPPLLRRRRRRP